MKIKNVDINFDEAIKYANHDELLLKHYDHGILLNDYQVNILKNKGFDFNKYTSMRELLFDIEEYLNDNYDDELDLVSNQIAELIYYRDTKK